MGKGRVTIPTDLDVVPQTLEMIEEWALMLYVTVTEQNFRRN